MVKCEATEEKFAKILHGHIQKYGPCIYSQGGHVVAVDAVEWPHASSSPVFTVREPFTGAYLKMTGKALRQGAWQRSENVPYNPNESCLMEAIFLTGEPLPATRALVPRGNANHVHGALRRVSPPAGRKSAM